MVSFKVLAGLGLLAVTGTLQGCGSAAKTDGGDKDGKKAECPAELKTKLGATELAPLEEALKEVVDKKLEEACKEEYAAAQKKEEELKGKGDEVKECPDDLKTALASEDLATLEAALKEVVEKKLEEPCKDKYEAGQKKLEELKSADATAGVKECPSDLKKALESEDLATLEEALKKVEATEELKETCKDQYAAAQKKVEELKKPTDTEVKECGDDLKKALASEDLATLEAALKEVVEKKLEEPCKEQYEAGQKKLEELKKPTVTEVKECAKDLKDALASEDLATLEEALKKVEAQEELKEHCKNEYEAGKEKEAKLKEAQAQAEKTAALQCGDGDCVIKFTCGDASFTMDDSEKCTQPLRKTRFTVVTPAEYSLDGCKAAAKEKTAAYFTTELDLMCLQVEGKLPTSVQVKCADECTIDVACGDAQSTTKKTCKEDVKDNNEDYATDTYTADDCKIGVHLIEKFEETKKEEFCKEETPSPKAVVDKKNGASLLQSEIKVKMRRFAHPQHMALEIDADGDQH